jgi:hypothetical protein
MKAKAFVRHETINIHYKRWSITGQRFRRAPEDHGNYFIAFTSHTQFLFTEVGHQSGDDSEGELFELH